MRAITSVVVFGCLSVASIHCVGDDPAVTAAGTEDGGTGGDGATVDGSTTTDGSSNTDAPSGMDVNGTLHSGGTTPLPNRAVVLIGSDGAVVKLTSGADGTFHASGIIAPYDILVPYTLPDGGVLSYPIYFAGIKRADPSIFASSYDSPPPTNSVTRTATISFSANTCVGCTIWISGASDGNTVSGTGATNAYTGVQYRWFGPATLTTPLHFYFQDATGAFTSHGENSSVALTDTANTALGVVSAGAVIGANPVLTTTATLPGGYTYDHTAVEFYGSDHGRIAYVDKNTLSSQAHIPAVANVTIKVFASGNGPNGEQNQGTVTYADYTAVPTTLALALPAGPTLLTPADAATGVTSSQKITWTAFSGPSINYVEIGTNSGIDLQVITSDASIDLGRLAKAGLMLGTGVVYNWHVSGDSSVPSVDEYVKPGGATPPAPGTPSYSAFSKYQTFTTQ